MPNFLPQPPQRICWGRRIVAGSVWTYLVMILAVWGLLHFGGDRWWFATLMLFGPRWPYALPLALLVPAVALSCRRLLIPLLVATVVLVGPVMRWCVPMPRFAAPDAERIRVLTCNVQGDCVDSQSLMTLISPSKSSLLTERIERRRRESEATNQWFGSLDDGPLIVAGDFNMPTDSSIYRRYWGQYANAFSSAGFGFGNTKHSCVAGWSFGARIDHVLAASSVRTLRCWVGPDVGSDHLPVIAELALPSR